ncbi:MAG: hypothetical protein A3J38_05040 [Gammaproteobacteria bacterium RIFCSPHIGHO2_12_FULL_45_9]|nr:MAG: hypothetical protein A3J38_05040 [Gammaproteobacteria bacterium RIFCSPHIGHO2_12_FULL_45_9]
MPTLEDSVFEHAVVYLHEHGPDGAVGIIINHPLQMRLGRLLEHINLEPSSPEIGDVPVLMGGPVGQEHGFILFPEALQATEEATETHYVSDLAAGAPNVHVGLSVSKEILQEIAEARGPTHYLVALGYAGWAPGQLEAEVAANQWWPLPMVLDVLFKVPVHRRWRTSLALLGVRSHVSSQIGHA